LYLTLFCSGCNVVLKYSIKQIEPQMDTIDQDAVVLDHQQALKKKKLTPKPTKKPTKKPTRKPTAPPSKSKGKGKGKQKVINKPLPRTHQR
jgi:hypothetical protein